MVIASITAHFFRMWKVLSLIAIFFLIFQKKRRKGALAIAPGGGTVNTQTTEP
jgi:hypothetical protein